MTVDQDWLEQQPSGGVEPEAQPATPDSGPRQSHSAGLGWDQEGDESSPSSPTAAAGPSGGGGGGGETAAAAVPAPEAVQALTLQKHLAFPDAAAERAYRLSAAQCCWLSELGLVGLQLAGWLAAAGRALEIRHYDILLRTMLLMLAPSLLHGYLLLAAPARYRPRRSWLSVLLRLPFDGWVVFTQDVPQLGIGGAVIHRGMPRPCKLLLMIFFVQVMAPQLVCLPWACSYAYSSALLALWLGRHPRVFSSGWAGALMLAVLLAGYTVPLAMLYRKEAEQRTAWAMRRLGLEPFTATDDGADAPSSPRAAAAARTARRTQAKLRARVDAGLFAPAEFLVPAAIGACLACL